MGHSEKQDLKIIKRYAKREKRAKAARKAMAQSVLKINRSSVFGRKRKKRKSSGKKLGLRKAKRAGKKAKKKAKKAKKKAKKAAKKVKRKKKAAKRKVKKDKKKLKKAIKAGRSSGAIA